MTEQEVNKVIDAEFLAFNKATYVGDKLPTDLMQRYEKAIFHAAPNTHRISSDVIKRRLSTKLKDLNNFEVGDILNAISATPLNILYKDINEALTKNREIELLKISYNLTVKEINDAMAIKRQTLLNLSGNGHMKIIPTAQA